MFKEISLISLIGLVISMAIFFSLILYQGNQTLSIVDRTEITLSDRYAERWAEQSDMLEVLTKKVDGLTTASSDDILRNAALRDELELIQPELEILSGSTVQIIKEVKSVGSMVANFRTTIVKSDEGLISHAETPGLRVECLFGVVTPNAYFVVPYEDVGSPPEEDLPQFLCNVSGAMRYFWGLPPDAILMNPQALQYLNLSREEIENIEFGTEGLEYIDQVDG